MTFYRIRHRPTGQYYQSGNSYDLNIGPVGQVYTRKPSLKLYSQYSLRLDESHRGKFKTYKNPLPSFNKEDWVIEKYESSPIEIPW